MKRSGIIAVLAALCLTAACTGVPYGTDSSMPDSVDLEFRLDWGKSNPAEDTVFIAMSRLINTIHYAWYTVDAGNSFTNISLDPDAVQPEMPGGEGSETEDGGTEVPGPILMDPASTNVDNGEYYMISFSTGHDLKVDSLSVFIEDKAKSMRDLRLMTVPANKEEIASYFGEDSPDFNPAYPYINSDRPHYIEVRQIEVSPLMESPVVVIKLDSLTQAITFRVNIELHDEVVLDDMTAEISGVGSSIEMMTGYIPGDTTCRAMFRFHEVPLDSIASSDSTAVADSLLHVYEGTVYALGLFPSDDVEYITGPGIMHLTLKASGSGQSKIFHAGINLRETILKAGLTEKIDDDIYRIATPAALLEVGPRLLINRNHLIPGEGNGIEFWFQSEDNNIDTEI